MARDITRRRRVVESHRIAAAAFRLGGVFGLVAAGWSLRVLAVGGSWWGPLHAFLAGTVLLAISGATQLFTVTWSAAPAPAATVTALQRWAVAGGVGLVLVGRVTDQPWVVGGGAAILVSGLLLLAAALRGSVQRSLLRRFDLSSRFYLLALGAGIVGVSLGGALGSGLVGDRYELVRLVHAHLNIVGLVGLTIVGTLPTLLPTFAHHRAVSGVEARFAWWLAAGSVLAILSGLATGPRSVGVGTAGVALSLLTVLGGVAGRLGRRGRKGGLAFWQVTAGCGWLAAWALTDGIRLLAGQGPLLFGSWTGAVVTAGLGQVLVGALAYLLPVLAGPAPILGRNLAVTHRRPWVPLAAANLAGIGFVAWPVLVVPATAVWVLDFAFRLTRIDWGTTPNPPVEPHPEG